MLQAGHSRGRLCHTSFEVFDVLAKDERALRLQKKRAAEAALEEFRSG
jgi:hypothetical protein